MRAGWRSGTSDIGGGGAFGGGFAVFLERPSRMARHRRPAHLCAPVIQWGSMPKCKHEKPMRAGDWSCGECGAVNYARRQQCYVCDHKPACKSRCGFDADAKLESCEIRPGDWQCITCGSLCFARRNKCFHCHESRHGIEALITFSPQLLWPGDWLCSECGYHNYNGRSRCHCCRHRRG